MVREWACAGNSRTLKLIIAEIELLELCELAQLRRQWTCRSIREHSPSNTASQSFERTSAVLLL